MVTIPLEDRIRKAGLKVTPQRLNVLRIMMEVNHPTADQILRKIREKYASVSTGTIYHILDTFVEKGIVNKVSTKSGALRYDAIMDPHHHLVDSGKEEIRDFFAPELSAIISDYFKNNPITGFDIEGINLNVMGKFSTQNSNQ